MKKTRVGILFGGKSAEHEVALQSAKNIIEAIDQEQFEVTLIGIDKQGQWHQQKSAEFLLNAADPKMIALNASSASEALAVIPGTADTQTLNISEAAPMEPVDIIFPVLHGPFGEDGTVQGLLKLMNVPFVGAGVLGSAVGMDKDVMKRLLRDAGIPIARFHAFPRALRNSINPAGIVEELGLPCFVKPANLGSSVGISRVDSVDEFEAAIAKAFRFDNKIIIEENIQGREIECSVLGNDDPIASLPGEVLTDADHHQFYSYEAKYLDEHGAALAIPANLPEHLIKNVQDTSIRAFQVLCCEGMARVDCFITDDERVVINEINTIPGFTRISMYPKLWDVSGISYQELITRLLQLAVERFEREQELATSV